MSDQNTYELVRNTNLDMMKNKAFSDSEKKEIIKNLLAAVSKDDTVGRFHKGVKAPEYLSSVGQSNDKRKMYPLFYITPYNDGKKLRLITGELSKTHILAANHYELEILRILALFDKDDPTVKNMIHETVKRLDTTCYAHWCPAGECVGAGISVLRFLSAISPVKEEWINKILIPVFKLYNGGSGGTYYAKVNLPVYYMYAAVSEISNELCLEFVESKKEWLMKMIGLNDITQTNITPPAKTVRPNTPDEYNLERWYVLKNALGILPEFNYLKSI